MIYLDIHKKNLKESFINLDLDETFIFQQDNNSKHTVHNSKMFSSY